jgi:hypothetical protein
VGASHEAGANQTNSNRPHHKPPLNKSVVDTYYISVTNCKSD